MNNYLVYIHTNKLNGKKYVGQTCQRPEKRWNNGKGYKLETYFGKAIKKYGWDNFEHEIVAENLTKEETKKLISLHSVRRKGAVLQFSKSGEFIKEWDCMATAMYALNTTHIPEVIRGKRKTAAGFTWKLAEES